MTFTIYTYIESDECYRDANEQKISCESSIGYKGTVANNGRNESELGTALVFGSFFVILLTSTCLSSYLEYRAVKLDTLNDKPEDFTVMVKHLPNNEPQEEIKKHFENLQERNKDQIKLEVEMVSLAYEVTAFRQIQKKLNLAKKKLFRQLNIELKRQGIEPGGEYEESTLSKVYTQRQEELKKAQKDYDDEEIALLSLQKDDVTKEVSFVTFTNKFMHDKALKYYYSKASWFAWIIAYVSGNLEKLKYIKKNKDGVEVSQNIKVLKAPDPSEIIWENVGISKIQLFCRKAITYSITSLLLILSFFILLALKYWQSTFRGEIIDEDSDETEQVDIGWQNRAASILISIIISVINSLLSFLIKFLTNQEKHDTLTHKNKSLFLKVVIVQFLNTCLMVTFLHILLVSPDHQVAISGGILNDVWFILLNDITLTPFMEWFDIGYYFKKFSQCRLKRNYKTSSLTQEEANKVFEGTVMDPSITYAKITKLILTSLFFLPLIPYSVVTCTIALFLNYWILKMRLLRTAVRPLEIGHSITQTATTIVTLSPIIMTVSFYPLPIPHSPILV